MSSTVPPNQMPAKYRFDRLLPSWIVLLAAMPLIHFLFLTSPDGQFSNFQNSSRIIWLPTLLLEIGVFALAVVRGLNLGQSLSRLSAMWKAGLLVWILILISGAAAAEMSPDHAIRGTMFWCVHLLFFASVAFLFNRDGSLRLLMNHVILVIPISAAACGLGIMAFVFLTGLHTPYNWVEQLPGFAHIRHTGYIFAPAIAVSLAQLAFRSGSLRTLDRVHFGLVVLNTAFMLWLGSRGPVFALMAGPAICLCFFSEMRSTRFVSLAMSSVGLGSLISILVPIPPTGGFGAIQRFWNGQTDPNAFSSGRLELWQEAMHLIAERPLFGHGLHQFQFASQAANGFSKHPHQSVLQILFDWGLIGGGLFLVLIGGLVFRAFVRNTAPISVRLTSAMVLSTMLCFSLIDGIFFYSYTLALMVIFLMWPITMDERTVKANQNSG